MRGTLLRHRWLLRFSGIIPAYAGNTPMSLFPWSRNRDHPRVCGEHLCVYSPAVRRAGSSPRMRGTLRRGDRHVPLVGIIPAYAGNTQIPPKRTQRDWDHPRVCGEHLRFSTRALIGQGSSPRMRGTPTGRSMTPSATGIIPAYAGNTPMSWSMSSPCRDHPRVCGEHDCGAGIQSTAKGSSPRMRGTLYLVCDTGQWHGIIPAYAGNTLPAGTRLDYCRDHPRVCGEHYPESAICGHSRGSSPRMRGTHSYWLQWPYCPGIIPAYAGNTGLSDRSG